jgi:hypothetical protein
VTTILYVQTPYIYKKAVELYLKGLESELQSYVHFKIYLLTRNFLENESSVQLLSNALRYEGESIPAFKSATLTINDNPIMKTKTV